MSRNEAVVLSAYSGVLICDLRDLLQYVSQLLGRRVEDYELSCPKVLGEIKRKSLKDLKRLKID